MGKVIYNPDAFQNVYQNDECIGFSFEFKLQYYRGITLSIIRNFDVTIDGTSIPRENLRVTVNGETFTMDEMRTVIDPAYRWEFGEYGKVTVLMPGGLAPGEHYIHTKQVIAPSYMPYQIEANCETTFTIA